VGQSIIDRRPLAELMARRSEFQDWYWIWDANHSVGQNELLRNEGFRVFGGGRFPDLMEHDRDFAIRYCAEYGLQAPETHRFTNAHRATAFLERRSDTAFVYKPDRGLAPETWIPEEDDDESANLALRMLLESSVPSGPFVLQERKRGVEANVEVWFVNGEPRFALLLLECKRNGNSDRGEMTGCSLDFVFEISLESPVVLETVGKLFTAYRRSGYTGFGDANVIIDEEGFWLLEKCERFGYNCHPNLLWSLNRDELGQTLASLVDGTFKPNFRDAYGASVTVYNDGNLPGRRLTIPEEILDSIYFWDVYKEGGSWLSAGFEDSLLMISASGCTPSCAWNRVMERVQRRGSDVIGFRTDGASTEYANSPLQRLAALEDMRLI